jgi:hypothetical protein
MHVTTIAPRDTSPTPNYLEMIAERTPLMRGEEKPCEGMVLVGEPTSVRSTPCGENAEKCLECADRRLYRLLEERRRRKEERERRGRTRDGGLR